MAHFAIRIGLYYGIHTGDDETDAIADAYDTLGIDTTVTDAVADSVRPATVREVLIHEYGTGWEKDIDHLVTVYNSEGFESLHPTCIVFRHTEGRNVYGYDEPVGIANFRVLMDEWSEVEGLSSGPYHGQEFVALELDMPAPGDLIDVLQALDNYPVLDDQVMSDVEQELVQEHWENYGRDEVLDAVAKAIGQDDRHDLSDSAGKIVEMLVTGGILDYGDGGGYPTFIDTSACDFGTEAVAEYVSQHLGDVVSVKLGNGYGPEVTLDLRLSNLVDGLDVAS